MDFLRNLFGKKLVATSAMKTAKVSALRLADPAHPAREQLEQTVKIVDQYVQVMLAGDQTAMKAFVGEMEKALSSLDEAIALCPDDVDLLVAKACVLHASAQFKSAEEMLDLVLSKAPDHFEAKMWKKHWVTWRDALKFPKWDERLSSLHPVMADHLRHDRHVQVVRDGMQKTLAIVTGVQGPPFDNRTQVRVEWVLSQTPYGPLVPYYLRIIEPSGEPSTMEAFLPIYKPSLFSPLEGYFLVQQIAFAPYCFVVLVRGTTATINRRIVFGEKTAKKLRDMVLQLTSTQFYLPQPQVKSAMQWHMNNFDMKRLTFD
jgi:tetratricopeptide (TPR) repeat protein